MSPKYEKFLKKIIELNNIGYAQEILMWDQETYMPTKGTAMRGQVQATLSGLYHEKLTDPELVSLVNDLKQEQLEGDAAVNLREIVRRQDRALKIPRDVVMELSDVQSNSYNAWLEARKAQDYKLFAPWLRRIVDLQKKIADLVGYEGSIYNAFFHHYAPYMDVEEVTPLFEALRNRLVPLLARIVKSPKSRLKRRKLPQADYPIDKQEKLNQMVLKDMGFDLEAGRLDVTVHPFTAGFCKYDVRITTRYRTFDWPDSLFSVLHEGGHGLYEQGLPEDALSTPAGESVSSTIHESQSRLWENIIGRSREFWQYYFPIAKELFPKQLKNVDLERFYLALNEVKPSLIRTEADEVTYNLHVLLRFELEKDLVEGKIQVEDLATLWNEKMEKYLGIRPANDTEGVLQDVHWSSGLIGYFPTYTLGNLCCVQFFRQAQKEIPDLMKNIAEGHLVILKNWLNQKIHGQGKRLISRELLKEVTGQVLAVEPFADYLETKFSEIYSLKSRSRKASV